MNIALIHYRVGVTDGVSLEMDKWKKVLLELGHSVYYIAGNKGNTEACIIPELSLDNEEMKKIHYNVYYELRDYLDESDFSTAIELAIDLINKLDKPEYRGKMLGQRMHNGQIFDKNSSIYLILPGLSGIKESATGYKRILLTFFEPS